MAKRPKQPAPELSPGAAALIAEVAKIGEMPIGPPPKSQPPAHVQEDYTDIIGGMSPEQFTEAVYDGVQEALGEADIWTVASVLDRSVGELLHILKETEGARAAQDAAIRFGDTILPYVRDDIAKIPYRKLKGP